MTPREVFERASRFVRSYDLAYADCFAEHGVLSLPFAPPGMPKRVEGRDAIRRVLAPRYAAARASGRSIIDYKDVRIHETTDLEVIVVEFTAIGQTADGSAVYELPFVLVIRVRDDLIVEQRDYFDSLALARLLS